VNKRASVTALTAALGSVLAAAPAWAQDAATTATTTTTVPAGTDNGGLLWVWVWILVIGVICIVGGASSGNLGNRKK
jgi:hypothetical protein